jgi:two-component system phosphate regulon sensor histidine kinase PhoR
MRRKLFWSLVGFSLVISLLLCGLLTGGMYLLFNQQIRERIANQADTLAALLAAQTDEVAFLQSGVYSDRVTLIAADGTVLFESRHDATAMGNHLDRDEISQALETGKGWASRNSETLGEISVYYARRLPSGQVLRVSDTQKSVLAMLSGMFGWLVLGWFLCMVLAAVLARPITRSFMRPLNSIDLDNPLQSDGYAEFSPMLRRMDAQNRRIVSQMERLKRQQAELNAILSGLREGLVVLDEGHHVLAINPAARQILGASAQDELLGRSLPEINRHETLMRLLKDNSGTGELTRAGRIYSVSASMAEEGVGVVLLLQDVTDARMAEQTRQQFSANVSHELRTPLTTISGYAELLETGLAKPEDTAALAGKIHDESRRMLSLIEDILRLSKLDEGAVGEKQPIDLLLLSQSCANKLSGFADAQAVAVTVEGGSAVVQGDRTLLEEMLINLIDNAIKYNRRGGTVCIDVGAEGAKPRFTIADTGVGIPDADQARVFERFYRVDKSRSKETGGTGLGLSIVKHGAQLHDAEISLSSKLGKGTTITLLFPEPKEAAEQP